MQELQPSFQPFLTKLATVFNPLSFKYSSNLIPITTFIFTFINLARNSNFLSLACHTSNHCVI